MNITSLKIMIIITRIQCRIKESAIYYKKLKVTNCSPFMSHKKEIVPLPGLRKISNEKQKEIEQGKWKEKVMFQCYLSA